ncbi:hypothetical protein PC39_07939 [Salinisphaera sp. PC39]|uniref:protein adenylyltransferase SelO n=1 Tax=Salinisphaera sp. PC39 TaxID=1304156 RepID=UPI00333F0F97
MSVSDRQPAARFDDLDWDNRLAALGETYAAPQAPTPLAYPPHPVAFSPDVAASLGLDPAVADDPDFVAVVAGNRVPAGAAPVAQVYAGHQFGVRVPRLGDGRAILLGQVRGPDGRLRDIQLKGAGRTPYARGADGRAILHSTVREFLASEAMAGLGIPTTRALAVVGSDDPVQREVPHTAAVLARVADTHVRFGSFEYFFYREMFDALAPLADHVIAAEYPDLTAIADDAERYRAWMAAVIDRTAELVADWQAVGFVHGVMNTDNMSVTGQTLDYGPFAFMDGYIPNWTPNHSDMHGRYAFDRQPTIALWNLGRFVQAILPLLAHHADDAVAIGREALDAYRGRFDAAYRRRMRAKLGLREARDGDDTLLEGLLRRMAAESADYTRVFRALGRVGAADDAPAGPFLDEFADREAAASWVADWRTRLAAEGTTDDAERRARMEAVNPKYVLRTYLAEAAVERAREGDFGEIERLRRILSAPCDEQPAHEDYARLPPEWARGIALSCSA